MSLQKNLIPSAHQKSIRDETFLQYVDSSQIFIHNIDKFLLGNIKLLQKEKWFTREQYARGKKGRELL